MELKTSSTSSPKPKKRWRKEESVNGITKSLNVEEVENGYVIRVCKYGNDSTKKDSKYIDEERTFISKENPLKELSPEEDEESDDFSLGSINATISSMLGGLAL